MSWPMLPDKIEASAFVCTHHYTFRKHLITGVAVLRCRAECHSQANCMLLQKPLQHKYTQLSAHLVLEAGVHAGILKWRRHGQPQCIKM